MINKNIIKILLILVLVSICMNTISTISLAASFSISDAIDQAQDFPGTNTEIPLSDIKDLQKTIYNLLFAIGIIVAVVGTAIMGIQFITSAPEGKAEIKQRMIPFVIGCIVIFAGFIIWKFAINLIQSSPI